MPLSAPEPLSDHHQIAGLTSGEQTLDDWLKRRARGNQASGASRTFVVCDGRNVVAYYALASGAIIVKSAPGKFRRNMPDPIPVILLARLAVDEAYQGRGLGRGMVRDAALRVVYAADAIGIRGIVVNAVSEAARAFYLALGFEPSPLDPMTLMITISAVRATLS